MINYTNLNLDAADVDEYLRDARFTQTFERAADSGREALRISYADYGYRHADAARDNVFLFYGPLMGSRMIHVAADELAKQHKVRIINPDRPGFGQTTDTSPANRIVFWRNAVLALLQHLNIRNVSLGAQSGGTVYALDFMLHNPQVLHPERPYIAIGAPWIHPSRSRSVTMSLAQTLPTALVEQTDKFVSLVATISAPMLTGNFGLGNAFRGLLPGVESAKAGDTEGIDAERVRQVQFEDAVRLRMIKFISEGPVRGLSQDAVMLMKHTEDTSRWSDWGDYDELIPRLTETLRARGQRLSVDVFLAETDFMIGNSGSQGPEWFKGCWEREGEVNFKCSVVEGADHNTTWDMKGGVPQEVFKRVGN